VIDVPWLDLDDMDGMRHAAEQARDLGFAGKGAVHPRQIAALNEVFTPRADSHRPGPPDHRGLRGGRYRPGRHRRES
jgi:citrate lyase beta subunit